MGSVNFLPWVGSNYKTKGLHEKKVLLLGEAHYGEIKVENPEKVTNWVVENLAISGRKAFFTKLMRLMLLNREQPVGEDAKSKFWSRVAFYNYCQEIVADKARVRPKDAIWKNSEAAFHEVLQQLKPDLVVVLGKELSRKIPNISDEYEVCVVNHPSSGFSYDKWIPALRDKLANLDGFNLTEI